MGWEASKQTQLGVGTTLELILKTVCQLWNETHCLVLVACLWYGGMPSPLCPKNKTKQS